MAARKSTKRSRRKSPAPPPVAAGPAEYAPGPAFPIVGIGASAGGLAAFEAFFSGMPAGADPGMAFVLVQHLAPDHKSILADLIRRYTRMQVFEVEDGIPVQPNCAYIIPPNHDMALLNGTLQLLEPSEPRGRRMPIDFFFRSLAHNLREHAIGIVLSGTGSDGTLGVRAIKGEAGMVMAQNPESTEFDGMPSSAIATGLVDYELPPAKMAAQLIAYAAHAFGKRPQLAADTAPYTENALKKIFILLRAQTGHDFSQYKPSTIHRRIERRMSVQHIDALDGYVKFLQQNPSEVEALFRDLLIRVSNFFRDPEAFLALESQIVAKLFADKSAGEVIRVWTPGCSTGEEAYSIAIVLQESMEALRQSYAVQIFATDIDKQAIATARAGRYPPSIAADISPERLARFFAAEPGGSAYCIHKSIRDMLVFSEQDVIKDPPFSKLDMVSCRNLLIYLNAELQRKLISLFHFALKPDGFLFLGNSESVSDHGDLFAVLDHKAKLYRRREDIRGAQRMALGRFIPPETATTTARPWSANRAVVTPKAPLRELTEQALLQQVVPAGALVNDQGDVLYLHGRTGKYLEPPPGEAGVNNLLKLAREGLRQGLSMTLRKAVGTNEVAHAPNLRVKTNGHVALVNLTVCPVPAATTTMLDSPPSPFLYLVILDEVPALDPAPAQQAAAPVGAGGSGPDTDTRIGAQDADSRIKALKQELRAKEENLQSTIEELESSGEELKSSNEEMQSVNEELQSTNEEMETAKEELQSVNEELATVNTELQTKVADLSRSNNDMNNLLAGTGIGTVFVDHQLRILRFTPAASAFINLIPADVGRPVAHIVSNLVGYDSLVADVKSVLDTLVSLELDVRTTDQKWFKMRILPYRTLDNVIEGAVITFIDVTEAHKTWEALQAVREATRLAAVVRDVRDAVVVQDLEGRIQAWNPAAVRTYGWSEDEALQMNTQDRIPGATKGAALIKQLELASATKLEPHRTQRLTKDGAVVEVWVTATALVNESGQIYAIATTERAIPEGTP